MLLIPFCFQNNALINSIKKSLYHEVAFFLFKILAIVVWSKLFQFNFYNRKENRLIKNYVSRV